jgi:hypothetical protein
MNDVQSLMTAAAILAMGGLGLFMYKGDEVAFEKSEQNVVPFFSRSNEKGDVIRDTPVEKQEIQEKTDEVAFSHEVMKSEQNFVPFFQKGETEIKPKKTRKMRKRSGGGSRHRF